MIESIFILSLKLQLYVHIQTNLVARDDIFPCSVCATCAKMKHFITLLVHIVSFQYFIFSTETTK